MSALQEKVYQEVRQKCPPEMEIKENYRPEWLISDRGTRLELDIYVPDIPLAIEVQGGQHYMYVPHFHRTYERFEQQRKDDEYKKNYCIHHKIKFIEIASDGDMYLIKDFFAEFLSPPNDLPLVRPIPQWRQKEKEKRQSTIENFENGKRRRRMLEEVRRVEKNPIRGSRNIQAIKKYSGRLWEWYTGEIDENHTSLQGKRKYGALTNLFEKLPACYEAFPISIEKDFIEFLEDKFPEQKYKNPIKGLYSFLGDSTNIF